MQIRQVIDNSNVSTSENDVEFIIQVNSVPLTISSSLIPPLSLSRRLDQAVRSFSYFHLLTLLISTDYRMKNNDTALFISSSAAPVSIFELILFAFELLRDKRTK